MEFFNQYFGVDDQYGQGFPSRWYYVVEYLQELTKDESLERFFSVILSRKYLRVYEGLTRENVNEEQKKRRKVFNEILDKEDLYISLSNNQIVIREYEDESIREFLGEGGFVKVYKIDEGTAKKVLKEEFLNDESIKHRFKREYEMVERLQDYGNIIPVTYFNEMEYSYEMKYCQYNLSDYLQEHSLNVNEKLNLVKKVIEIVSILHQNDVIHRDLNPYNILIDDTLYLSDFGIGKDMNQKYSHMTQFTNGIGNHFYTAPEQLISLKNSSKQSDVYSLGKIINFIFNGLPQDENHVLQPISSIASLENPDERFDDASIMEEQLQSLIEFSQHKNYAQAMENKIMKQDLDSELVNYFHSLGSKELVDTIGYVNSSERAFIYTLKSKPSSSYNLLRVINENISTDYSFSDYDKFSDIAMEVLNNSEKLYPYNAQMEAAELLYYVATTINRFNSQDKIETLISGGLDPIIEKILSGEN